MKHLIANLIRWAAYKLHGWAERISPEERSSIGALIGAFPSREHLGWFIGDAVGDYIDPDVLKPHADEYKVGGTD